MPRKVHIDEVVADSSSQGKTQGVMLDEGSEADTEWSDQENGHHHLQESDSIHSLSLNLNLDEDCDTEAEKTPREEPGYSMKGSSSRKGTRSGGHSSQGKKRSKASVHYDAADYIMDKIDSELYSMTGMEPQLMMKKRPSKQQRSALKEQGVEFDTGDETNQDSRRFKPDSLGKLHSRKQAAEKDEGDTGLGTASVEGDSDVDARIVGKVDIYASDSSEEDDSGQKDTPRYDALDSDMAKQLDEKYKHILKSKSKDAPSMPTLARKDSLTDHDSVKTEDIEREYKKTLVNATPVTSGKGKKIKYKSTTPKRMFKTWDGGKPGPKVKTRPSFKTGSKKSKHMFGLGGQSDHESVMTEDYEHQFQNVMVKQVANVPITTFDKFLVDSDVDTVRSQYIRDRFQAALCKSMCSESDGGSSDGESSNMEALIERKFQEIIRKTQLQIAGIDSSGTDTTGKAPPAVLLNGDSEGEDALQNTWPRSKSSRKQRKSTDYRQKMRQHDENAEMELGEEARQMERESARMRQEMESERKRSGKKHRDTPTPVQDRAAMSLPVNFSTSQAKYSPMTNKSVDQQVSARLQQEHAKLQAGIQQARRDKQTLQLEIKQIQNEIKQHDSDKKNAERQMKENRARAEDARTELMLAEFKRDSAKKELDTVQEELGEKKKILEGAAKEADLIDQSKESYEQVVAEREELQLRVKNMEQLNRERQELEKQLASAKENLISEQKRSREKLDAIREELESREVRLEEMTSERDSVQRKHDRLELRLSQFDADRQSLLQEKTAELEDAKSRLQAELAATQNSTSKEVMEVRQQVQELSDRLANSQSEINRRDEDNMKLREQMLELQHELTKESENKSNIHEEAQKNINAIIQEKETTLATVIREAEQEKREALDQLARDMERQHKQVMAQMEGRYQNQVSDAQGQITAKEIELDVLRERLAQQETTAKNLQEKIRVEAQDRFCHLMKEERDKWEMTRSRDMDHEMDMMRCEMEKEARQLRDEIAAERDVIENQIKQITCLKKELEEARQTNRNIYREKLAAMNQVKETAEMEKERELDMMKEKIEHETHRSIDRLRETIRHQEDELQRLRQENMDMHSRQQENSNSAESFEKAIIDEINDECRRTAQLLGTSPRVVSISGFTSWTPGRVVSAQNKPSLKAAINAAMNNMKQSHEELRKAVGEVQDQLVQNKKKLGKIERDKKEDFDKLRHKMQNEKIAALETLKDRLIKEHLEEVDKLHKSLGKGKNMDRAIRDKDSELQDIQRNMNKWKDQTTEKLARKFHEELTRELDKRMKEFKKKEREWEREKAAQTREIEKLEREVRRSNTIGNSNLGSPSRMTSSGIVDDSTKQQLQQLQGKVKALQNENLSLRRSKLATSVPDLSIMNTSLNDSFSMLPTKDDRLGQKHTELQLQRAENKAKLAEERAEKNEKLLNQKILELSKLQGTLTQQTKELMQLERSYSQLQRPSTTSQSLRAPSPVRTPSRPSSRLGFPR